MKLPNKMQQIRIFQFLEIV